MGEVYKAEDSKLHRHVALKFLTAHLLQDEDARKRLYREAQAAAAPHQTPQALNHQANGKRMQYTFNVCEVAAGKRVSPGHGDPLDAPEFPLVYPRAG